MLDSDATIRCSRTGFGMRPPGVSPLLAGRPSFWKVNAMSQRHVVRERTVSVRKCLLSWLMASAPRRVTLATSINSCRASSRESASCPESSVGVRFSSVRGRKRSINKNSYSYCAVTMCWAETWSVLNGWWNGKGRLGEEGSTVPGELTGLSSGRCGCGRASGH